MNILIADDHAVVRNGLKGFLLEEFPFAEVVEASDAESLFKLVLNGQWDLIISDLSMPGLGGFELIHEIKRHYPKIPILILSIHPIEMYGPRVLKAGASGYLNKDTAPPELKKAINWILQGRKYISPLLAEKLADELSNDRDKLPHELLTDRELHILKLLAVGNSQVRIGEILSITASTVASYRSRIMKKMQLHTNADLTRYCLEHHLST